MHAPNRLDATSRPASLLQQPAPRVELPPYNPADHMPPTPPMPTSSLSAKGILYLHTALVEALGLRPNQAVNLVSPIYGSLYWHLDLRPTAPRRITWTPNQRPRVEGLKLPPGLVTAALTLHLLPGEPPHEDYYPLLPANAFAA